MQGKEYPWLIDIPESRTRKCKVLGTGAAAPTKVFGQGVKQIVRIGAGDYQLSYAENPGRYLNADSSLESVLMTDLKNFSVIFKPLAVVAGVSWLLEFSLFNAAGAATDLAANQFITVYADFCETGMTLP